MNTVFYYLAASGVLTVLMWIPYILARIAVWGVPTFLNNYPANDPTEKPDSPLWAQRAKRAHLNMVETMPAFIAVVLAATLKVPYELGATIGFWTGVFFFARLAHATVYILGIPYLRTPTYLVSWIAILVIGALTLN